MRHTLSSILVVLLISTWGCDSDSADPGRADADAGLSDLGAGADASGGDEVDGEDGSRDGGARDTAIEDAAADAGPEPDAESRTDVEAETDAEPETDVEAEPDVEAETDAAGDADAADLGAPPEKLGVDAGRPARVHVPDAYDPSGTWPLVIMLHGYSANGFAQDALFQLSLRVSERGFILVLPDGTKDADGNLFWNASPACCNLYGSDVDDVAYLRGLVEEATATMAVDPERVSFVGHSNGGFMALRMACDAADLTSAAVSLAGADPLPAGECEPAEPVSILLSHGTDDTTIRYQGGGLAGGAYPGAPETATLWAARNGCSADGQDGEPADYDDDVDGAETVPTRWTDCDGDVRTELWRMEGSAHVPILTDAWRDAVVDFVLRE